MDKKAKERAILRMVYNESIFEAVDESERPDFILRYPSVPQPFGVEITELYFTEADARLRNVPDYMSELWTGGSYRHKDDKKILRVTKVKVIGPDGVEKASDMPAIFRELPPVDQYARQIATAIKDKGMWASGHATGLSHVNLVIIDRGNRLRELNREHLYRHIFIPEVKEALVRTPFREVLFLTDVRDGSRVVIPMKQALLLAEFGLFSAAVRERCPDLGVESDREVLELFVAFMGLKGAHATINDASDESAEVFFGNVGLRLAEHSTNIYDYADHPMPKGTSRTAAQVRHGEFLDNNFMAFSEEFSSKHKFIAAITYDALTGTS